MQKGSKNHVKQLELQQVQPLQSSYKFPGALGGLARRGLARRGLTRRTRQEYLTSPSPSAEGRCRALLRPPTRCLLSAQGLEVRKKDLEAVGKWDWYCDAAPRRPENTQQSTARAANLLCICSLQTVRRARPTFPRGNQVWGLDRVIVGIGPEQDLAPRSLRLRLRTCVV